MIIAAADGSALGNPGPAGWSWYVDDGCWAAGGWPHGTNNQGELTAVLELFRATAHLDEELLVQCDSQYVINALTKWMPNWKRKGWRKADGSPVLNLELMQSLDEALRGRRYRFEWVRGHAGHPMNEAADERARAVAIAYQRGGDIPTGPGWTGACEPAVDAIVSPGRVDLPDAADDADAGAGEVPADAALFDFDDPTADWTTLSLELTTEEHTRLVERARAAGVSPEEFLRGLI
ncbi:RNase H family protein [Agromyces indicus]|uniref:Ribonuclease H n=1 Tax=Agromyces indicus TaxID=758919 RepID=A0ABU1FIY6_9MICO|nr:RNase H family protein [Agromyces indicus]MDR5691705.1 RNase H family protein [Agromyces indicus]